MITSTFGGNGSYGFGLGIWRTSFGRYAIWTVAIGPLSIYWRGARIDET